MIAFPVNENLNLGDTVMTSFITTPIFYANGDPHLGHAYSGIIGDIFHRFALLTGEQSLLITGTDEHGQKIALTAEKNKYDVKTFVDTKSATFSGLWPELNIHPDIFIRTTHSDHKLHVSKVWQKLYANDDIYLGAYSGEYCVACEQFYPERELGENKHCPVHKKPVQTVEEETYLFRLEKYRAKLLDFYQSNPGVVTPQHFQQSIIAQLQEGPLEDLSVSRINNTWGVKVPNDVNHTIYVWIDALFSYITAIEQTGHTSLAVSKTKHVLGKDIFKFHALYWPAFLLALDLPMPKKLIVHGWWTVEGNKISKSIPETTVHPSSFSQRLTNDGLRYALVRQKPLFRDGNLAINELTEVVNADLANNFANLVKRNHALLLRHFDGKLESSITQTLDQECLQLLNECQEKLEQIAHSYRTDDIYQVSLVLKQVLTQLNSFFHHRAPWLISKGQESQHVQNTCFVISNILREVAFLYSPITPNLAKSILEELKETNSSVLQNGNIALRDIIITEAKSHFERI
ncbi:methionine--tRNA ligase [Photobacterium sp. GB-27]|uniref:methionine--tRNA ligase n=1 Tax=Photobacterium sp. GB-27 TaxID=2022109 RepID=UPI000D1728A1|nr:methionine--tRNA ligase [Photobacterium sp. GB-27]PSV30175.1 methionine--tRNA ligase [Photobacterium sp. GB-27]